MAVPLRNTIIVCHAALFTILVAISNSAWGDSVDVRKIDWQFLDALGDIQSSKCIGDPKTPFCAVETYYACIYRQKKSLCDVVNAPFPKSAPRRKEPLLLYSMYVYGEINRMTLNKSDIPKKYYKWRGRILREGDVAIRTIRHTCLPNMTCLEAAKSDPEKSRMCRTTYNCHIYKYRDMIMVLRPAGSRWTVGGEYFDSEFPKLYPGTERPPRISSFTSK